MKLAALAPKAAEEKKLQAQRRAAAEAAAQERYRAQQAALLAEAKRVVVRKYAIAPHERNALCTANGLPPYRFEFEEGTYAQNAMVALDQKCVRLFPGSDILQNAYCCPW